jgi:hypothetical protein
VDEAQRPLGLVSRTRFVTQYAKPYFKELYGRQSCTLSANLSPRLLDLTADIDTLTAVLTSEDQRYLSEGSSSWSMAATAGWAPVKTWCAR